MSEEESAKAKPNPARSPAPPVARVAPTPGRVAPVVTPVRARPLVAPGPPQSPAALRTSPAIAPSSAISPKPPNVAGSTGADPEASGFAATELAGATTRGALESTIHELTTWRREAEKRIASLEAEVLRLRSGGKSAGPPTGPDLHRDATGPLFPEFEASPAAPPAPWSPAVVPAQPAPASPAVVTASPIAAAAPAQSMAPAVRRVEPRPQYDLEMKPGEYFDLPSELNGGKKKRFLFGLLLFLILAGMGALVVTALASQR